MKKIFLAGIAALISTQMAHATVQPSNATASTFAVKVVKVAEGNSNIADGITNMQYNDILKTASKNSQATLLASGSISLDTHANAQKNGSGVINIKNTRLYNDTKIYVDNKTKMVQKAVTTGLNCLIAPDKGNIDVSMSFSELNDLQNMDDGLQSPETVNYTFSQNNIDIKSGQTLVTNRGNVMILISRS